MAKKELRPEGYWSVVKNAGIKDETKDLVIVKSDVIANAAAFFTENDFCGEPIKVGRRHVRDGKLQAIVVNSKNANVATGERGYRNALTMCYEVATEFGIGGTDVLPSSTGVIGKQLPIQEIVKGIRGSRSEVVPLDPKDVATGIMTTDKYPKHAATKVGNSVLVGVAKGAGMIEPKLRAANHNQATMLSYFFTDAEISVPALYRMMGHSIGLSFNSLTVDSDTSTSDTVAIMANGLKGKVNEGKFQDVLDEMSIYLAREIARNGEGATKLIEVEIYGARNQEQAQVVAKSIANSPLVKTAIYGNDANWGRIVAAAGKCGQRTDPNRTTVHIGNYKVFSRGEPKMSPSKDKAACEYLKNKEIKLRVDLGLGTERSFVWTCDLTEGYIQENASYRS